MRQNKYWVSGQGIRSPRATDYLNRAEYPSPRHMVTPSYSVQDLRAELYGDESLDNTEDGRPASNYNPSGLRKKQRRLDCAGSVSNMRLKAQTQEPRSQYNNERLDRPLLLERLARERTNRDIEINVNLPKGKPTPQEFEELLTSKTIEYEHLSGELVRDRQRWEAERRALKGELIIQCEEVDRLNMVIREMRGRGIEEPVKDASFERTPRSSFKGDERTRLKDIEEKTKRLGEMERQERMTAKELLSIIAKLRQQNQLFKKRANTVPLSQNSTQTDAQVSQHPSFQELQQLQSQNDRLQHTMARLTYQITNLLTDKTNLLTQNDELIKQNNGLKKQLAQSKNNAKKEMEKLIVDLNTMADMLVQKETENQELMHYKNRVEGLERGNVELRTLLKEYQKQENILMAEKITLSDNIDQLESQMKDILASKISVEKTLRQTKAKLLETQEQLIKQQNCQQKPDTHFASLSEQISKLNQQLKMVGSQLQLNNGLNKELKMRNETLQQQLLTTDLRASNDQQHLIDHLSRQISLVSEEIQQINSEHRGQLRKKEEALRVLREEMSITEGKYQQAEFEKKGIQIQIQEERKQAKRVKERLEQKEKKFNSRVDGVVQTEGISKKQVNIQTDQLETKQDHSQTIQIIARHSDTQTKIVQFINEEVNTETITVENKQEATQTDTVKVQVSQKQTQTLIVQVIDTAAETDSQQKSSMVVLYEKKQQTQDQIHLNVEYNLNLEPSPLATADEAAPAVPQSPAFQIQRLTQLISQLQTDLKFQKALREDMTNQKNKIQELILQRANKHQQQLKTMLNTNQQIAQNMMEIAERNSQLEMEIEKLKGEQSQSFLKVNSHVRSNSSEEEDSVDSPKREFKLDDIEEVEDEESNRNSMVSRLQSLLVQEQSKSVEANNMVDAINELPAVMPRHNIEHQLSGFAKKECRLSEELEEASLKNSPNFSVRSEILPQQSEIKSNFEDKLKGILKQSKLSDDLEKTICEFLKKLHDYSNKELLFEQISIFLLEMHEYEKQNEEKISALQQAVATYLHTASSVVSPKLEEASQTPSVEKIVESEKESESAEKIPIQIDYRNALSTPTKSVQSQESEQPKSAHPKLESKSQQSKQTPKKQTDSMKKVIQQHKSNDLHKTNKVSFTKPAIKPPAVQRLTAPKKIELNDSKGSASIKSNPPPISPIKPNVKPELKTDSPKPKQSLSKFTPAKKNTKK